MKKKTVLTFVLSLGLYGVSSLHAQEAVSTAGGDAGGGGGSSSYTVGQVAYTTYTGVDGSVAQGVQQAEAAPLPPSIPLSSWSIYLVILLIGLSIWLRDKKRILKH